MQLKIQDIEEIEMDLTGSCNLSCPLCTRNYVHAQHLLVKNVRPFSEIRAQLDKFVNLKRFFIAGAISEPTLYPEFIDFIKYLNSRGIKYELFSNGNTHDEEWWRQLGKIVPKECIVAFTVCGSTQELHSKYRRGSNLQQILDNASAFRENRKKNDWVQVIRFEYNIDDIACNMNYIFKQFSNHMIVDSEGIRRKNDKISCVSSDIMPPHSNDVEIRFIFSQRDSKYKYPETIVECKSYHEKKVYIDQFGRISPCYVHAEFENDFIDGDVINYDKICNKKYPDCFLCTNYVKSMMKKFNLEFIN